MDGQQEGLDRLKKSHRASHLQYDYRKRIFYHATTSTRFTSTLIYRLRSLHDVMCDVMDSKPGRLRKIVKSSCNKLRMKKTWNLFLECSITLCHKWVALYLKVES